MSPSRKTRLNLYIGKPLLDFAKKWSYVTGVPISGMLEEYLRQQQERVAGVSPFQWLNDQGSQSGLPGESGEHADIEEYLTNAEEEQFCREHPEHPRAKLRQKLIMEYERSRGVQLEEQKMREREFIARWLEVFPIK